MGTVQGGGDRSGANAESDADRCVVKVCVVTEKDDESLTLRQSRELAQDAGVPWIVEGLVVSQGCSGRNALRPAGDRSASG